MHQGFFQHPWAIQRGFPFTARKAEADPQRTDQSNYGSQHHAAAQDIPATLSNCHKALLIWRSLTFYKGSACHHSILQTVKTGDKPLALPKRQSVGRGEGPHLLCLSPSEPRAYQFPSLSQVTSHSQCINWTFVEAFKYRERKEILK